MVPAPVPDHQDFLGELYVILCQGTLKNSQRRYRLGRVFYCPA